MFDLLNYSLACSQSERPVKMCIPSSPPPFYRDFFYVTNMKNISFTR